MCFVVHLSLFFFLIYFYKMVLKKGFSRDVFKEVDVVVFTRTTGMQFKRYKQVQCDVKWRH